MNLPDPLKIKLRGFSSRRVAWVLCLVSAILLPANFYVSCNASGTIGADAVALAILAFLFCLISPAKTPGRFDPALFAFGLALLNALAMH
ncbi:hypothetical protein BH09VER1_BH09VER1_44250 [soil metagenome]